MSAIEGGKPGHSTAARRRAAAAGRPTHCCQISPGNERAFTCSTARGSRAADEKSSSEMRSDHFFGLVNLAYVYSTK